MLLASFLTLINPSWRARGALSHIKHADLTEAVELYRQDTDKPGFLAHVRQAMIERGLTDAEADKRIKSFLVIVRQKCH